MATVGIIGTGWGVRTQLPLFRRAGLQVVALAGSDADKTRRLGGEHGLTACADWRELVALPLDLVSVTAPPALHAEIAIAALRAGRHVLCEKPTALDAGEAEAMLAVAREHPTQLALIDHELRFLPAFVAARERVAGLGGVRLVEARYSSASRGDRQRKWTWWNDAAQGGGMLGAVGSHLFDLVRYLVGEIGAVQATLVTVIGELTEDGRPRAVTADDLALVHARLAGGGLAALSLCAVAGGPDEPTTITIHGERGALRLVGEELLAAGRREGFQRVAGGDRAELPGNSTGGAFGSGTLLLGQALRRALDEGARDALAPAATFADGLLQQRLLDAARASHASGGGWVATAVA